VALQNLLHTLDQHKSDQHKPDYAHMFYFTQPLDTEGSKDTSTGGGSIFQPLEFSGQDTYKKGVRREYMRLLPKLDGDKAKALEKRLKEFHRCGDRVAVRTCEYCGGDRPESGSFAGTHRTCKWKACPYCSWVRAKKVGEFYERAAEDVEIPEGWSWQLLTVTTRYSPWHGDDVKWEALRVRARLVLKAARHLWKTALKVKGAAMFRSIECSTRGHVHAHLPYMGPEVDSGELTRLVQHEVGQGLGYVYSKTIEVGDADEMGNRLPAQIGNAAKYMAKGTFGYGSSDDDREGWFEQDEYAVCIDPRLAARWEIATYKMRLTDRYGVLRGVDYSESDYRYETPDDSKVACHRCGTKGEWKTSYRRTEVFIQDMHWEGLKALEGSNWEPWWRRKKREEEAVGRIFHVPV